MPWLETDQRAFPLGGCGSTSHAGCECVGGYKERQPCAVWRCEAVARQLSARRAVLRTAQRGVPRVWSRFLVPARANSGRIGNIVPARSWSWSGCILGGAPLAAAGVRWSRRELVLLRTGNGGNDVMAVVLWVASILITIAVTWLVTWYFYRKGAEAAQGDRQSIAALGDELSGISRLLSGSPQEVADRLRGFARSAQVDVRTVEKVLVTLKDEEIAELVRRELRRLQGPDGSIRRSELVKGVSDELRPGSFDDIRRIIELMRQNGEIEYAGNFDTALSLRYRPTARKSASAARQESGI
jgi:hypothetical protein